MTLSQEIKKIESQLKLTLALHEINQLALNYFRHLERLYEKSKQPQRIQTLSQLCMPLAGTLHEVDRNKYIRESEKHWLAIEELSDIDDIELDAEIYNQLIQYPAGVVPKFSEEEERAYFRSALERTLQQLSAEYNQLDILLLEKRQAQEREMMADMITELELAALHNELEALQREHDHIDNETFDERMVALINGVSLLMKESGIDSSNLPDWLEADILQLAELEDSLPSPESPVELQDHTRSVSVDSMPSLTSSSSSDSSLDTRLGDDEPTEMNQKNRRTSFDFFTEETARPSSRRSRVFFEI